MGKRRNFIENIMEQTILNPEFVLNKPIVEIAGDHRVLIENHQGVSLYGKEKILINVLFGSVCICGCNLELVHMTMEQIVICGKIEFVELQRRRC